MEILYSKEKLDEVSEHLEYEVTMFFKTAILLHDLQCGVLKSEILILKNLLIESFVIHARNLIFFLYPLSPNENNRKYKKKDDDILAADIICVKDYWKEKYPDRPTNLDDVYVRTNKLAAHLTYSRIQFSKEKKDWEYLKIANTLGADLKDFFDIISEPGDKCYFYEFYDQIKKSSKIETISCTTFHL
jgi:hypothetical protein